MEIDNSNIPSGPNSLTLLFAANDKSLAKHFHHDGSKKSYDNAYLFIQTPASVGEIRDLQNIMRYVSQHEDRNICLIRGAPRRHISKDMLHRRTLQNYQDVPRSWVILDIDDLPLPEGMLSTSQDAVAYAVSKLPACFHDRDYVYHFSSSAGLGGQVLKCHLGFLLSEPVSSGQLRRWARSYVNPDPELVNIDAALFNAVQVHYLADPIFDNPSMDPFAGASRIGLVKATHRAVPVSTIIDPPVPVVLAKMPSKTEVRNRKRSSTESAWRTGLDEIHDDRLGLHAGIVHTIKHAVQELGVGVDRAAVKLAIRDRITAACAAGELDRDQGYIDNETHDARLDRIFDWAIERGYAIQFIERTKSPRFALALNELEAVAKGDKTNSHTLADLAFTAACVGFYQCPARLALDDMLTAVRTATQGQLPVVSWEIIERRIRERYRWLVDGTLSSRKILRHETIQIQSLDEIDVTKPGVHIVKAPMGSGKTEQVARRLIELSGGLACVINHRISLSADLANRLKLDYYKDAPAISERGVVTCVNSILTKNIELVLAKAPGVVVDEFSQTIEHLAIGPVDDRPKVYDELLRLLREKEVVVLLDADINDRDIDVVETAVADEKSIYLYEMPESWAEHTFGILPSAEALSVSVCHDLRAGEKVTLAIDSKTGAKRIVKQIAAEIENRAEGSSAALRVLVIHAENSGGLAQKAFLNDPDGESGNYDLLIYSPSISSGVSLKSGHFTRVYGLYHGVVPGREFFQMLRRNRTVTKLSVASKPIGRVNRVERAEDRLRGYQDLRDEMGLLPLEEDTISALAVNVQYNQEVQQQNAFNRLVILAEDMGYQIVREEKLDDAELAEYDFDPLQRAEIKAAKNLTRFEYDELRRKNLKNQEESYQIRRHRIQRALGLDEATPTDDDFDYIKAFGIGAPRQFELLRSTEEENRVRMAEMPAAEVWSYTVARKHRLAVLDLLGIDSVDFSGEFCQSQLKDAVRYLIEQGRKINRVNIASKIVPVKKDRAVDIEGTLTAIKPKAVIEEFFRKMGLTIDCTGTSAKYRRYSVSQDGVARTVRYVAARGNIKLGASTQTCTRLSDGRECSTKPFARTSSSSGETEFFELKHGAFCLFGKKGVVLIELLAFQQTVPLATDWIASNRGLSDKKAVREWSNAWGSITFQGLHRFDYKPVGVRGRGGRKQIALSLEHDPQVVKEHLERLLSVKIENVHSVATPASARDLAEFKDAEDSAQYGAGYPKRRVAGR